jgi:hypothetical protein
MNSNRAEALQPEDKNIIELTIILNNTVKKFNNKRNVKSINRSSSKN